MTHHPSTASRLTAILLAMILLSALPLEAQRRVTPVEDPDKKAKTAEPVKAITTDEMGREIPVRPASVVEQRDIEGRTILVDTISGKEYFDTILTTAPKLIYPFLDAVTVGTNVGNLAARMLGQQYGVGGVWAELSIHNWFKPMVEVGLGQADYRPNDKSYHYTSPLAPYFKLGLNYNFLYNSNPDYSVCLGLRYGLSSYNFEVTDGTATNSYWQESMPVDVPRQRATSSYGEMLICLRVMVAANVSVQWDLGFRRVFGSSKPTYGNPWYIPGYGSRSNSFTWGLSVCYTIPLRRQKPAVPPTATD